MDCNGLIVSILHTFYIPVGCEFTGISRHARGLLRPETILENKTILCILQYIFVNFY